MLKDWPADLYSVGQRSSATRMLGSTVSAVFKLGISKWIVCADVFFSSSFRFRLTSLLLIKKNLIGTYSAWKILSPNLLRIPQEYCCFTLAVLALSFMGPAYSNRMHIVTWNQLHLMDWENSKSEDPTSETQQVLVQLALMKSQANWEFLRQS